MTEKQPDDPVNQSDSDKESATGQLLGSSEVRKPQFGIAAMFWATFLAAMVMTYLKRLSRPDTSADSATVVLGAGGAVLIGLVIGFLLGKLSKRMPDALFWSTLVAAFGYISTVSDPLYSFHHSLAWVGVGAISGGTAATAFLDKWYLRGLACAVGAGVVMIIYYVISGGDKGSTDLTFDLNASPLIGFAVAGFVYTVMRLESRQKMPRYITATWLMVAVILGNIFSR